jgi:hypothetical protein
MVEKSSGFAEASLSVLIRQGEVCRCLRSKKLFYQSEDDESPAANAAPFWCLNTQSVLGPDGEVVGLAECRPGRKCCETA